MIEFQTSLDHTVAKLAFNKEHSIVFEEWKETSADSIDSLKAYQKEKYKLIDNFNPVYVIWDYRDVSTVWDTEASDLLEYGVLRFWNPRKEIKKWAVIKSENPFVDLKVRVIHKTQPNQHFKTKFFKKKKPAIEWILK